MKNFNLKLSLLFIALLIHSVNGFGQLAGIQFGGESRESKFNFYTHIIDADEQNLWVMRLQKTGSPRLKLMKGGDGKATASLLLLGVAKFRDDSKLNHPEFHFKPGTEYFIEKYDRQLNQQFSNPIKVPDVKNEDFLTKNAFRLNNKNYLFNTTWFSKDNKTIADFRAVADDGSLSAPITIGEIKEKTSSNSSDNNTFEYIISEDKNTVLVYAEEVENEKKPKLLHLYYFDSNLSKTKEETLTLDIKEKDVETKSVVYNNDGKVAILMRVYYDEKERKNYAQKFYFKALLYSGSGKEVKITDIRIGEDDYVADIKLSFSNDGKLQAVGFYSGKSANKIKGFFSRVYNTNDLSEEINVKKDLPQQFFTEFMGQKKGSKAKEISDMHIRKSYYNEDGSFTYIAEKYHIEAHSGNNSGMGMGGLGGAISGAATALFIYNYEDLAVFNMNRNGDLNWVKKVVKYQRTTDDGGIYNSFAVSRKDENLYFLYNANRNDPDDVMLTPRKATSYITKIDRAGNSSTEKLFNARDEDIIMTPKINMVMPDGTVIVHNIKNTRFKFARVSFN
jgi:hypothetical protein